MLTADGGQFWPIDVGDPRSKEVDPGRVLTAHTSDHDRKQLGLG